MAHDMLGEARAGKEAMDPVQNLIRLAVQGLAPRMTFRGVCSLGACDRNREFDPGPVASFPAQAETDFQTLKVK